MPNKPTINLEVSFDGVKMNSVVRDAEEQIALHDFARTLAREIASLHALARAYGRAVEANKKASAANSGTVTT